MSKQHTQTPYIFKGISETGKNHFNIIGSKLGGKYRICQVPFVNINLDKEEAEKTARFIVKACNNHDRLVEALELFSILNENAPEFRCIAGLIKNARELLTELKS